MFLKRLKLVNFRNYERLEYQFDAQVTVLVGDNAQGKSNFLESIYFLSTTKSYKADKDEELVRRGEEVCRAEGIILEDDNVTELEVVLAGVGMGKRVKVNGVFRRIMDYIGNLPVVPFAPEDINLVTGAPALRRWHIDLTLAQIDREYKKALTAYENVVASKNRILKNIREGVSRCDELDFWVNQQLLHGGVVSDKRRTFFEKINSAERRFGNFFYEYQESELLPERLVKYQSREIDAGTSLFGPHRDDFKFIEMSSKGGSRDLAHFGSRGEQRAAVLDLKVSEVSFIEGVLGSRPILLLDDVFSELDLLHRKHVLELTMLQQTIIATVELDGFLKVQLADANVLGVKDGVIEEV